MRPTLRFPLLLALLASACMPARTKPSPLGARVTLYTDAGTVSGELLAINDDSLWVLSPNAAGPRAVGRSGVRNAIVHRGAGVGSLAFRGVLFGAVTGLGMFGACASLSGDEASTGCGGVFVTSTLIAGALGLFAASSMESARDLVVARVTPAALARFARWPQGRPQMEAPPSSSPPAP